MAVTYSKPLREALEDLESKARNAYDEARRYGEHKMAQMIQQQYYEEKERLIKMNDPYGQQAMQAQGSILSDQIHQQYMEAQKQQMMNQIMSGTGVTVLPGGAGGLGTIGTVTAGLQNIAKANFKPEFGVLYLHQQPLPEDWAGAKITRWSRGIADNRWVLSFFSEWDKQLTIALYLDVEDYNGKEVNEMAKTYMEALNQRRAI